MMALGVPVNATDHTVTRDDLDPFAGTDAELAAMWPGQRFTAPVHDTHTECRYDLRPEEDH